MTGNRVKEGGWHEAPCRESNPERLHWGQSLCTCDAHSTNWANGRPKLAILTHSFQRSVYTSQREPRQMRVHWPCSQIAYGSFFLQMSHNRLRHMYEQEGQISWLNVVTELNMSCSSTYFLSAAAVCTTRKKKLYEIWNAALAIIIPTSVLVLLYWMVAFVKVQLLHRC